MSGHVAHHFDDADQQFESANLGMWVFLTTEVLFFGGLFAGYTQYRSLYPEAFAAASSHLDVMLGTINTAVLLTSSLTMALAVRAAQVNQQRAIRSYLAWTIVLGSVFLGVKAYEYHHKYEEHLIPGQAFQWHGETASGSIGGVAAPGVELFYSFYFAMTGLHATHMIIGIPLMALLWFGAGRGRFSSDYYTPVEMMGLYWHFVDIVWVFLFPLLYLIG